MKKPLIFCDMDGVLTNFEDHFIEATGQDINTMPKPRMYKTIAGLPAEWWATMGWMKDGEELWKHLSDNFEGRLHILTSPSIDKEYKSHKGKRTWLKEKGITDQLGEDKCIIDTNKHHHVVDGTTCILIDDTQKKIDKWRGAGGIGILHTDTKSTLIELNKHLNES